MEECIICAEGFEERYHAFGACNHRGICGICFLRIRTVISNFDCPICKQELDSVVCTNSKVSTYGDYRVDGVDAGPEFTYDLKSKMFFPRNYYRTKVENLWLCKCTMCGTSRRDLKALKAHVAKDHNFRLCELCIDNKKVFPSEQRLYSQAEYDQHLRYGDKDGSEGHPLCEFCKKRYYDKTSLFTHLIKDHFSCHICEKNGIRYKYYNNYLDLENHFREEHFLCEDPMCLAKKYIVFGNSIDHSAHLLSWHPQLQISRTIPIFFKSARDSKTRKGNNNNISSNNNEVTTEEYADVSNSSSNVRNEFARSRFEGGLGGRAEGGEWQVQLPDTVRDPRDMLRGGIRAGASVDDNSSSTIQISAMSATTTHEFLSADYPSLMTAHTLAAINDLQATAANPPWVAGARGNSYPPLNANSNSFGNINSGNIGNMKVKPSKQKKNISNSSVASGGVNRAGGLGDSTVSSYKEAIEPPAPLAVRIVRGEITPNEARKISMQSNTPQNMPIESLSLADKIKKQQEQSKKKISVHSKQGEDKKERDVASAGTVPTAPALAPVRSTAVSIGGGHVAGELKVENVMKTEQKVSVEKLKSNEISEVKESSKEVKEKSVSMSSGSKAGTDSTKTKVKKVTNPPPNAMQGWGVALQSVGLNIQKQVKSVPGLSVVTPKSKPVPQVVPEPIVTVKDIPSGKYADAITLSSSSSSAAAAAAASSLPPPPGFENNLKSSSQEVTPVPPVPLPPPPSLGEKDFPQLLSKQKQSKASAVRDISISQESKVLSKEGEKVGSEVTLEGKKSGGGNGGVTDSNVKANEADVVMPPKWVRIGGSGKDEVVTLEKESSPKDVFVIDPSDYPTLSTTSVCAPPSRNTSKSTSTSHSGAIAGGGVGGVSNDSVWTSRKNEKSSEAKMKKKDSKDDLRKLAFNL